MVNDFDTTQLPDLDQAVVQDNELNKLLYSDTDYAPIDLVVEHLQIHQHEEPEIIHPETLSVNGILVKDEMEQYLANKAISSSACKEALKTPLHYFHYVNKSLPQKDKSHFELGTFCHMAFLEPDLFDLVLVEPSASLASNEGVDKLIEFWEAQIDVDMLINCKTSAKNTGADLTKLSGKKSYYQLLMFASGKIAVTEEHAMIIKVIKSNYYRYGNGIIPKLLRGACFETSIYTQDPSTGLDVKVRPDAMNFEENIGVNAIISFKTTHADTVDKFQYDSAQYKYELSEGMYLEVASHATGRKFNCVITIMLQTVAPYLPAVLFWDADDLQNGKYKYHNALQTIKDCKELDSYPGFDAMAEEGNSGIILMKQPNWAMKELLPVSIN